MSRQKFSTSFESWFILSTIGDVLAKELANEYNRRVSDGTCQKGHMAALQPLLVTSIVSFLQGCSILYLQQCVLKSPWPSWILACTTKLWPRRSLMKVVDNGQRWQRFFGLSKCMTTREQHVWPTGKAQCLSSPLLPRHHGITKSTLIECQGLTVPDWEVWLLYLNVIDVYM